MSAAVIRVAVTAMGAAALHLAKVEALFAGNAAGQGRGKDPLALLLGRCGGGCR